MKKKLLSILLAVGLVFLVNFIACQFNFRVDLTEDGRYTLSDPAIESVSSFNGAVMVDNLLDGTLPPEFIKLKQETELILEQFAAENNHIDYAFVDPLENQAEREAVINELQGMGLTPTQVTTEDNGKVSNELIFPWAIVSQGQKSIRVPLLKTKLDANTEERINMSVQSLEYAFADGFTKLAINDKKKIAVLKGNGELPDAFLADYLSTVRDYYNIGAFTLDSIDNDPQKVLDQLKNYDLALVAKPTIPFTDEEKYILDQYIVNGGKSLWLIDPVHMELDSLFNEEGTATAMPRDLNLNDFFFKYGVRINNDLVNDLYFSPIVLANGDGNNSQYNPLPWFYNPMVISKNNHPINNNIESVRLQFASTLDTLQNENKKTILLQSSPLSKPDGTPRLISLAMAGSTPNRELYTKGDQPLAVLLEGKFKSAFTNRIKPIELSGAVEQGPENQMLVIADGDIVKNQLRNGRPLELGYDKWTNTYYGNKEFLINATNFLLDDTGLINIRNKKVSVPLLDGEKIRAQKSKWQLVNIGIPVLLTLLAGLLFQFFRKRKYAH